MSITVKNLVHTYAKKETFERIAINDVSFHINDGEFIGLIGHTGSGKSTLIQHLCGLLKADSGSIEIDGIDICQKGVDMQKIRSKVGIVFQYPEYQLFEETVYRDIAFGPSNLGKKPDEIDRIIHEVMSLVGLPESILQKSPFELSGGQKRRVAIAGVLAMEPEILILDEPTAGLDPLARKNLLMLIKALHSQKNITVILVSHSMEDIAETADKVMVMSDGRLVMFDTAAKVFSRPDELTKIGLNVPQVSVVVNRLKQCGIDLGDNIYSVEAAGKAILDYLQSKNVLGEGQK
ncbi:MAG: energy-coupling factor transporter ATPase [Clostridia bacterium]|nr:energy-coupling factor transporter ATPase [Clostridia bacterium]